MANLITIDEGLKTERVKVMYDVRTLNGVRKRKSKTFPPKTPKRVIEQFKREKEYEYINDDPVDATKRTMESFGDEFFEIHCAGLSPTTIEGYLQMYKMKEMGILAYLSPTILLNKVTGTLLQKYLNDLIKIRSRKTVKNYQGLLRSMFKKAYQLHYITIDPSANLIIPREKNVKVHTEEGAYEISEAQKILALAEKENIKLLVIEGLGILAGLRKGEMAGLKFEHVFLDNGQKEIRIIENRVQAMGKEYIKDPKTKTSYRTVQIPDMLAEILKKAKTDYLRRKLQMGKSFIDSGYVINQKNGEKYSPDSIYNMHRLFLKAHPEIKYHRLHTLRHTYASISINSGINPKVLQVQMGHSQISTTLNMYTHVFESSKREEADKLNDIMTSKKIINN